MVSLAEERSNEMGALQTSYMKGDGNIAGFVGEFVIMEFAREFYPYEVRLDDTYDYDLMWGRWRVDVKTKRSQMEPLPHYEASIPATNVSHACDMYVFVRVLNDMSQAFICGWETRDRCFSQENFKPKGAYDESNQWTNRADAYSIKYGDLRQWRCFA